MTETNEKTSWESFKAEGANLLERVRALIHEGNVRRVVIEHQGKTIAEFPLTAGLLGLLAAPVDRSAYRVDDVRLDRER